MIIIRFENIKLSHLLFGYIFLETLLVELIPGCGSVIYGLLMLLYFLNYYNKNSEVCIIQLVKTKIPKGKEMFSYFKVTILLLLFSISITNIINYSLYLIDPGVSNEVLNNSEIEMGLWQTCIKVVIIAPILEELVFRGVIFKKLSLKYNAYLGMIITSIIFGVLHNDIIGAFTFSVIACMLYVKTKNILAPMLVHFFNNFISCIGLILSQGEVTEVAQEGVEILTNAECIGMIQAHIVFALILCIFILIFIFNSWDSFKEYNEIIKNSSVVNDEIVNNENHNNEEIENNKQEVLNCNEVENNDIDINIPHI